MKKRRGVFFDTNYTTYKLGEKTYSNEDKCVNETKLIYHKNFRNLYPLNDETLEGMARFSDFPMPLLEKLSSCFAAEDKDLFLERCEQMHQLRVDHYRNAQNQ